jgi:predicted nicotinamide N-methyase
VKLTTAFAGLGVRELILFDTVFNPEGATAGAFLADFLYHTPALYAGMKVLDLGCGSGILGIICRVGGARHVCFSDINPEAAANAQENIRRLGITDTGVKCGHLFDPWISHRFDLVVFNAPGKEGRAADMIALQTVCPPEVIERFYETGRCFLESGGKLLVATSTLRDPTRSPLVVAPPFGYAVNVVHERTTPNATQYAVLLTPEATQDAVAKGDAR